MESLNKMVAGVLALAGFAIACIAGLSAGAGPTAVLWNALGALFVCLLVGLVLGRVAEVVLRDYVRSYRSAHPLARRDDPGQSKPGETPHATQGA